MTEQADIKISMLVDGELDRREAEDLLRDLRDSKSLQRQWQHYHLIGDAMRHGVSQSSDKQLASNILKALESEPALTRSAPVVVYPSFSKPVAGLALAASVAAVTVLGFQLSDSSNMAVDVNGGAVSQVAAVIADEEPETRHEPLSADKQYPVTDQPEWDYGFTYPVNAYGNDVYVIPRESHSVNLVDFETGR